MGAPLGVDMQEAVAYSLAWVLKLNLQPLVEMSELEEATMELQKLQAGGVVALEMNQLEDATLEVNQLATPLRVEPTLGEEAALKLNQPGDATLDMNHLATPLMVEAASGEEAALKMSRRVKGGQ